MSVSLRCTVRGCAEALSRNDRTWRCPRGHSFDENRRGVLNLLQPQDRRSKFPGDSKDAVEARHRLARLGYGDDVHRAIEHVVRGQRRAGAALLDVGCGEGALLRALASVDSLERHGLDLSAHAIDLATKSSPGVRFVIANADRSLPYVDRSFDFVTSIDARFSASEFSRVLGPGGLALIVVPAPDDMIELRAAIGGESVERLRIERVIREAGELEVVERMSTRDRRDLGLAEIKDLLTATYRGFRKASQEKVRELRGLSVTMSHDVVALRKR